jgi:signal transduction histidine kinase
MPTILYDTWKKQELDRMLASFNSIMYKARIMLGLSMIVYSLAAADCNLRSVYLICSGLWMIMNHYIYDFFYRNYHSYTIPIVVLLAHVNNLLCFIFGSIFFREFKTLYSILSTLYFSKYLAYHMLDYKLVYISSAVQIVMWLSVDLFIYDMKLSLNLHAIYTSLYIIYTISECQHYSNKSSYVNFSHYRDLRESKFLNDKIVNSIPESIILLDQYFDIRMLNKSSEELFSKEDRENLTETLMRLKYNRIENFNGNLNRNIHNDIIVFLAESEVGVCKTLGVVDYEEKSLEMRCTKIMLETEPAILLTVRDVTTLLDLHKARVELECKGAIVRSLSHELRTPVNCIINMMDEISQEKLSDLGHIYLRNATSSAFYLLNVINDIIDFSQIISHSFTLSKKDFDLKSSLRITFEMMKPQIESKGLIGLISIDSLIPDTIFNDEDRIRQIIVNLLSNSIKFTQQGFISVSAFMTTDCICRLSVEDSGIGISSTRLPQIFQFKQHLDSQHNTKTGGLGLHISSILAGVLGSELCVSSREGEGSKFEFHINVSKNGTKNHLAYAVSDEDISMVEEGYRPRPIPVSFVNQGFLINIDTFPPVLIVDDTNINRDILRLLLCKEKIKSEEAESGFAAIDKIKKANARGQMYDIVIMDCDMPGMDGLQAASVINKMYEEDTIHSLPTIIAHSAFSSQLDIDAALQSGMHGYIPKPVSRDNFLRTIKPYLGTKQKHRS